MDHVRRHEAADFRCAQTPDAHVRRGEGQDRRNQRSRARELPRYRARWSDRGVEAEGGERKEAIRCRIPEYRRSRGGDDTRRVTKSCRKCPLPEISSHAQRHSRARLRANAAQQRFIKSLPAEAPARTGPPRFHPWYLSFMPENHSSSRVIPIASAGDMRRKKRATPKGRMVDPQALSDVRSLLGDDPRRADLLI